MVPFGAAASPDLTILPVFLAAAAAGTFAAIGALIVFSAVTIGTIVGLTLFACFGGYQLHGEWLDRWGNAFTALVLLAIGVLVLVGHSVTITEIAAPHQPSPPWPAASQNSSAHGNWVQPADIAAMPILAKQRERPQGAGK